jgi:mono/diheme cytochrome c family protein
MFDRRSPNVAILLTAFALAFSLSAVPHDPKKNWPVPEVARKMKNPVPRTAAAMAAAKAIFNDQCVSCHGETGKGDGPDAMMYDPQPADLSDAHMMSEMTDGEIFYKITEGRKPMPSFKKKFTDEQRWQLVHFVRAFASRQPHAPTGKKPAAKKAPAATPKPKIENRN